MTLTHIFQGHFFFSPQKSVITLYLVERSSLWVSGASTNKYTFKTLQVFLQLNWNHLTLTLALATIVDLKLYYPYSGSHDYSQLAASPRRRGLTVASRLWLCIFKQSLRDCDLTTVASRLWLYLSIINYPTVCLSVCDRTPPKRRLQLNAIMLLNMQSNSREATVSQFC